MKTMRRTARARSTRSRPRWQVLLASGLALLVSGSAASAGLDDGLAAHYPFNGNADDESGNGHHATVIGATLTQDRFGNVDSAFAFDGQNDYILIGQQPNFPSWGSNAVSMWFLNDGGGVWTGYGQKLINKGTYFSDFYAGVYPVAGGTQYCTSMPWTCIHYADHDFRDGEWHHLVMMRSGSDGEMWIDGELKGTSTIMSSSNTSVPTTVGYSLHPDWYQRHFWSGKIDDVRIYDRTLTDSEIQELFSGGGVPVDIKPGSCPNPLNRTSGGVLPVSVVSSESFDALSVDVSTVLLSRADGVGGSVAPQQGAPGPGSAFEDTATAFDGEPCDCHDLGGDSILDLSMKFDTASVVEQLELNDLPAGEQVELVVSGELLDGTPVAGRDCIVLVPLGGGGGPAMVDEGGATVGGGLIDLGSGTARDEELPETTEKDDRTGSRERVLRRGAKRRDP